LRSRMHDLMHNATYKNHTKILNILNNFNTEKVFKFTKMHTFVPYRRSQCRLS